MKILGFLCSMVFLQNTFAGILSVSSVEAKFAYNSEFQTSSKADAEELTTQHAQFFFGYFQSPTMAEYFHVPSATLGIAAVKLPLRFHITSDTLGKNGKRVITYKADGTLLLHKKVAKQILEGGIKVTLPYDVDNFYELKCTDKHYPSALDFWYFYDPFREGCGHLRETPMAKPAVVTLRPVNPPDETVSAGFKTLRSDNGNGDMFEIATINGFSESSTSSEDDGRKNYDDINNWLRDQGFQEKVLASFTNRPVLEFTKTLTSHEGRTINVRIVRLLAETGIGSKNVTFAKFFRRALENSDVVIYSGHSGLGGNLHIPSLEMKSGEIQFNPRKRQLFFFDSCSSYSYDLAPFESKKTKGKIDILTQGLPSYFWAEPPTHKILFKYLLDVDKDPSWLEVLKQMEKVLEGQTQMMSVGSV